MNYVLGIDLGTSATKTVLFDENGVAIASHSKEYPIYQEKNGYAEQNPMHWWDAACVTIKEVIAKSSVKPSEIKSLGISGQMHGLIMLGEDKKVLRNSIIWCDGRTDKQCEYITEKITRERLIDITANPALTGFTLGKILWVRDNEPEIYDKCRHILLPKDYIKFCLSGEMSTEVSDASGMNLLDIRKRDWSDEIITELKLDKSMFKPVSESHEVTAYVSKEAAELTGLLEGTKIVSGGGDNACAAVGMGAVKNGRAFCSIGTSGVIFAHTDKITIDKLGRVHTFCAAVEGEYTAMSCSLAAGLSLKWFRDNFCTAEMETAKNMGVDPYFLMDKEADKVQIGADKLIYLPYLMGERSPILDSYSRGAFIGLSGVHTKNNMLRAVMEGVIYSQKDCLEVLEEMKVVPNEMLACGGGGTSKVWRQMMADVFELPINTVSNKEGPALGAALLAAVGAGMYKNVAEACDNAIKYNEAQGPIEKNSLEYKKFYGIYKDLYPNLKDSYKKLYDI